MKNTVTATLSFPSLEDVDLVQTRIDESIEMLKNSFSELRNQRVDSRSLITSIAVAWSRLQDYRHMIDDFRENCSTGSEDQGERKPVAFSTSAKIIFLPVKNKQCGQNCGVRKNGFLNNHR